MEEELLVFDTKTGELLDEDNIVQEGYGDESGDLDNEDEGNLDNIIDEYEDQMMNE